MVRTVARRSLVAIVLSLALPSVSFARKKAAASALTPMKAGIHQKCLQERVDAEKPAADAWIALGHLDQVRGDLKGAFAKYKKAFALGTDIANVPIDFVWVGDVIWIQNDACPVPVPALPNSALTAPAAGSKVKGPEPIYPASLLGTRSEGNARPRVWVGADGKAMRIAIIEATASMPGMVMVRNPGEEAAERLVSRVQFALTAMELLRGWDFGSGAAGTIWEHKFAFTPTNVGAGMPGGHVNTSALPSADEGGK